MQEKLKTLKIIHLAICGGVLVAYIILGQITSLDALKLPVINNDSIIYLLIPFAAFLASNGLYKFQLKKGNPKLSIEENLPIYQTASIIRWAILEGAALVLLVLKKDFIVFGLLIIVYLFLIHPSEDKIKRDLNISTF
jgi:hypothetical protein